MEKEESGTPVNGEKEALEAHLLPYANTVGGVVIKPLDKGKIKGRSVAAMYQQTDVQLGQLRRQVELLAREAEDIRKRVRVSEKIYEAEMGFQPLISFLYHLYLKRDGLFVLSMVSPEEWGRNPPYIFQASVRLLADHTWEIVSTGDEFCL